MNFYAFHLGDYLSATAHLSWDEDLAYRRLMDAYYTRELPLPLDGENLYRQVYRLVRASTDAQREAVQVVLDEFFEPTSDGWVHSRCEAEIHAVAGKREKASNSAKARWRKATAMQAQSEGNASAPKKACERMENECEGNAPIPIPIPIPKEDQKPCAPSAHTDDLFAKFWSLYPSKKDKAKAAKAFAKLKITDDLFNQIISGLAAQVASHDWTKEGGKYIPMPTTWLNGKRWEDEVKPSSNVHSFPGQSRHHGLAERFVAEGVREDGTHAF